MQSPGEVVMTDLHGVLEHYVRNGSVPGAVALVAHGDRIEVAAVGSVDLAGTAPMARDSIFRIASLTKPIVAAAVLMLVDRGRIGPDEPVARVPAGRRDRFTSYYRTDPAGGLRLADAPAGQWSSVPPFPSGGGGLVSTADDWYRFGRMLLGGGTVQGRRLLAPDSVRRMTT